MKIKTLILFSLLLLSLLSSAQYKSRESPKKVQVEIYTAVYGEGIRNGFKYYIQGENGRETQRGEFEVGETLYLVPPRITAEAPGYLIFKTSSFLTDKISPDTNREIYFDADMYYRDMIIPITVVDPGNTGRISISVKVYGTDETGKINQHIKYIR